MRQQLVASPEPTMTKKEEPAAPAETAPATKKDDVVVITETTVATAEEKVVPGNKSKFLDELATTSPAILGLASGAAAAVWGLYGEAKKQVTTLESVEARLCQYGEPYWAQYAGAVDDFASGQVAKYGAQLSSADRGVKAGQELVDTRVLKPVGDAYVTGRKLVDDGKQLVDTRVIKPVSVRIEHAKTTVDGVKVNVQGKVTSVTGQVHEQVNARVVAPVNSAFVQPIKTKVVDTKAKVDAAKQHVAAQVGAAKASVTQFCVDAIEEEKQAESSKAGEGDSSATATKEQTKLQVALFATGAVSRKVHRKTMQSLKTFDFAAVKKRVVDDNRVDLIDYAAKYLNEANHAIHALYASAGTYASTTVQKQAARAKAAVPNVLSAAHLPIIYQMLKENARAAANSGVVNEIAQNFLNASHKLVATSPTVAKMAAQSDSAVHLLHGYLNALPAAVPWAVELWKELEAAEKRSKSSVTITEIVE